MNNTLHRKHIRLNSRFQILFIFLSVQDNDIIGRWVHHSVFDLLDHRTLCYDVRIASDRGGTPGVERQT